MIERKKVRGRQERKIIIGKINKTRGKNKKVKPIQQCYEGRRLVKTTVFSHRLLRCECFGD